SPDGRLASRCSSPVFTEAMSMATLTFEPGSASGLNRMSAVHLSNRPRMASPLQAVLKLSAEPGSTFHVTGAVSGAAAAGGAVAPGAAAVATVGDAGATSACAGGRGSAFIAGRGGWKKDPKAM